MKLSNTMKLSFVIFGIVIENPKQRKYYEKF